MPDEWFSAICLSSLLFEILMSKKWVEFSLAYFGTLKYDCATNTRGIFNFLPLINNTVTIEVSFLLLIISEILSSKTINILRFLPILYFSIIL